MDRGYIAPHSLPSANFVGSAIAALGTSSFVSTLARIATLWMAALIDHQRMEECCKCKDVKSYGRECE